MRILIDMDGVLYDLQKEWLARYNKDYNDNLLNTDILTWDMHKYVKCGKRIYDYFDDPTIYRSGELIHNAYNVTKRWFDGGHELAIVTAYARDVGATEKARWLRKHFPHIKNVMIQRGHIKHWVHADLLIDDGYHNLEHFQGLGILFTQTHNVQHLELPNNIKRAHNWLEIEELVDNSISYWDNIHGDTSYEGWYTWKA